MIPAIPTDNNESNKPLGADVERGLRWTAMRQIITALAGMVGVLFYARFLDPAALGEASLALLVYEGLVLLIREPIGGAIVHFQGDETDHPGAAFWLLMGFSIPASILVMIASPWIARFYGAPEVAGLTQAVVIAFLLTSLGTVPAALLLKRMRFPLRETFLTGYILIQFAGWIALSALGFGAWSLVLPAVFASGLWAAANWIAARYRPVLRPARQAFADIFRFARRLWGSQLLAYAMDKIDNAAVGTLGKKPLGLYAFGEDQSSFATFGVATVIAGVMLPAIARAQDKIEERRRIYLELLRITAAASLPMQIGAILAADLGIGLFFGDQWAGAVPVFRAYVFYQTFTAFSLLSGAVVAALGRPDIPLRLNVIQLPLFIAATWFGMSVWGGIFGVAMSLAAVRSIMAVAYLIATWRLLGVGVRDAWRALGPGVSAALIMGAVALGVRIFAPVDGWIELGATVGIAAPLYFALLWLFDRAGFAELVRVGVQIAGLERIVAWLKKASRSPEEERDL